MSHQKRGRAYGTLKYTTYTASKRTSVWNRRMSASVMAVLLTRKRLSDRIASTFAYVRVWGSGSEQGRGEGRGEGRSEGRGVRAGQRVRWRLG